MPCRGEKAGCQPGGCKQPALSWAALEQAPPLEYISVCSWGVLVALVKEKLLATFLFTSSYAFQSPPCVSFRIWAAVDKLHLSPCETNLWLDLVRELLVFGHREGEEGTARASGAVLSLAAPPDSVNLEGTNAQKEWRPAGCSTLLVSFSCPRDHWSKQRHVTGRSATYPPSGTNNSAGQCLTENCRT